MYSFVIRFIILILTLCCYLNLKAQELESIRMVKKRTGKVLTISTPAYAKIKTSDTTFLGFLLRSKNNQLIVGEIKKEDQKGIGNNYVDTVPNDNTIILDFKSIDYILISTKRLEEKRHRKLYLASSIGLVASVVYFFVIPRESSEAVQLAGAVPMILFFWGWIGLNTKKFKPSKWEVNKKKEVTLKDE